MESPVESHWPRVDGILFLHKCIILKRTGEAVEPQKKFFYE